MLRYRSGSGTRSAGELAAGLRLRLRGGLARPALDTPICQNPFRPAVEAEPLLQVRQSHPMVYQTDRRRGGDRLVHRLYHPDPAVPEDWPGWLKQGLQLN